MRAARDGSMPRSEASPAAASAHCHSECTSAHPSACVAVMRFLLPSIHLGAVYFAFNGSALCTELLVPGERPVAPSPTLDDGELFAGLKALFEPSGASSRTVPLQPRHTDRFHHTGPCGPAV